MTKQYILTIHGGCENIAPGNLSPESEKECLEFLRQSLAAGRIILKGQGHALDAAQEAIRVLEDAPCFNAGRGSVFAHTGRNEMDASLMNGENLQAGAIAATTCIKNPIFAARMVMDRSDHVLLTGSGAEEFAAKQGLEIVDPVYFFTPARWEEYQQSRDQAGQSFERLKPKPGTVGAVALDKSGNLAAGSSTGGLIYKKYGRLGDSPIIGAGIYADNAACAVSCTGEGEFFLRRAAAKRIAALVEFGGFSLESAAWAVLENIRTLGGKGGVIAVDTAGHSAISFTTRGMFRGLAREGEMDLVAMFGPPDTWR